MNDFGLDIGGGDLLDLGMGLFSEPPTNSSNSNTGSNDIPLSVGTPTGVASLQSDGFPTDTNDTSHTTTAASGDKDLSSGLDLGTPTTPDLASATNNSAATSMPALAKSDSLGSDFLGSLTSPANDETTRASTSETTTVPDPQQPTAKSNDTSTSTPSMQNFNVMSASSVSSPMTALQQSTQQQSASRPHITSMAMPTESSQAMAMGTVRTPGQTPVMQQFQQPQQQMANPQALFANDMSMVRQQLMQQPDLIAPPPHIIHAGQQYAMIASRFGNQHVVYQQRQQQMYGVGAAPNYSAAAAGFTGQSPLNRQQGRPGPVTAWQSEADIPLRRKMIAKIVSLLQQRKPDAPQEWIQKLPDMARRLEDSLYRTAGSRNEYGNFSTLKQRLQALAIKMGASTNKRPPQPSVGGAGAGVAQMNAGMSAPQYAGQGSVQQNPAGMQYPGNQQQQQMMMQQRQMQMQMQQQQALQRQTSSQHSPGSLQRQASLQHQQQMQLQQQLQRQSSLQMQQQQQQPMRQLSDERALDFPQPKQDPPKQPPATTQSQQETDPIPDFPNMDDDDFLNFDLPGPDNDDFVSAVDSLPDDSLGKPDDDPKTS